MVNITSGQKLRWNCMNKATQITECSAEETGIYGDTEEENLFKC